ncbi:MAG: MBL fold metallo-hydrolase [Candidatus Pacearchaeota archaeon]|nr:MBL fold metallo-hydrolase [Candidatus Pacearchaeota archaeon]
MSDILKIILEDLPKGAIENAHFEGANIVIYTKDRKFFQEGETKVREIVNKIKKRIELRASEEILLAQEEAEKIIRSLVPKEADIQDVLFDDNRSIVVIEAKRPGIAIGHGGEVLRAIKEQTFWIPQTMRSPAIQSKITDAIRRTLFAKEVYRKKFLNSIGRRIYKEWNPDKKEEWVRISVLGAGRQVGRSCFLLQTPESKILLDCGIDMAATGPDKFPYLNAPEFDIKNLDAVILTHAHLDHCLPPDSLVLTEQGYKKIDDINVGENIVSLNWQNGRYIHSKCTEKTKTTGHKKVLTLKTTYSQLESSPNHRFFVFEGLKLKELEASQLNKGMLIPSNLFFKPKLQKKSTVLCTNVEYDKRRKDNVVLPETLSQELAEFVAYYMGDGHKSSDFSLRLTDSSVQLLEHHKQIVKNVFNHEAIIRHHPDKTKNAFVLEINNVKIIRFLEKNFPEAFLKTREICVPENVKNASSDVRRAFIRGFGDADGTVTRIVKICSFSKKMLEDLQHLFSLEGIASNIKRDNTICLNAKSSIYKFFKDIGFSSISKQKKLNGLSKESNFDKQDLLPITPEDFRNILKQGGMFGRVHNSPKLSKILPIGLLDFFRRKGGYVTRKTVISLSNLLKQRLTVLNSNRENANFYALRQLLSITRSETCLSTGLKMYQIQNIEDKRTLSTEYAGLLSSFIKEKLSMIICQTEQNIMILQNLLSLNVVWERIIDIEEKENPHPYLVDIEVENHNFIAGNIIVHNSGFLPYLYKLGFRGPCYMTTPTRDIAALLALDFIGVSYKKATTPLFKVADIKTMVKHAIDLNYNEVTDITPDVRLTLYNAGHCLGSAMIHLNIGNGLHNLLYTGDFKFIKTRTLDSAAFKFPRLETLIIESTYGGRDNIFPTRKESEDLFLENIKKTIDNKGKVLVPILGVGRAQEIMLIVENAFREGNLPNVPVYVDGLVWDVTAIHTAYPESLAPTIRNRIFQDENPFDVNFFHRVGSPQERQKVLEGGPCLILATSGMLVGGASVEYFKNLADSKRNAIIFVSYLGPGSTGRQVQEGAKEVRFEDSNESIPVNLNVFTIEGMSGHASRAELINFINTISPIPRRVIVNHGEQSRCLDLASSIYKLNKIETIVPRNLEAIRLK